LIGQETAGTYSTYHFDLRGSTVAITDANGKVTDRYQYSAYGELLSSTGDTNIPFLFNGHDGVVTDGNGLYYMRARYYNPEIRRFVSQDTLLGVVIDGQSLNRYAYVQGNPIGFVDPLGLARDGSVLSIIWSFGSGAFNEAKDDLKEIGNMVFHPIQTTKGIGNAILHPIDTGKAIWSGMSANYTEFKTGDANTKAYIIGGAVFSVLGTKAIGKASKVIKGTSKTGSGCFTAGTLIPTEYGQSPIEEIKIGDYVWSENPETGEKGLKKVVNTFIHDKYTLVHVYTGDTMIETTEEHPFWVEEKGWVLAGELNEGDVLRLKSGENVKVTKLERVDLKEPVKVYNFEVQDWHTYYVSDINVLVHNKAARYNTPTPVNPKRVDTNYLKKNGIDPHSLKYDTLGDGADISKYNIYVDKNGELWILKNGSKEFIPTYESIGR
jgi:RHS repeat-associated protein